MLRSKEPSDSPCYLMGSLNGIAESQCRKESSKGPKSNVHAVYLQLNHAAPWNTVPNYVLEKRPLLRSILIPIGSRLMQDLSGSAMGHFRAKALEAIAVLPFFLPFAVRKAYPRKRLLL